LKDPLLWGLAVLWLFPAICLALWIFLRLCLRVYPRGHYPPCDSCPKGQSPWVPFLCLRVNPKWWRMSLMGI